MFCTNFAMERARLYWDKNLCVSLLKLQQVLLQLGIAQQRVLVVGGIVDDAASELGGCGADCKAHYEQKNQNLLFISSPCMPQRSEGILWLG